MTPDIDGFWPIHERFICTLSIRMGVNRASEIVGLERWYFAWLIRMQIVSTWNPMRILPGVQAGKLSFVQSMDIGPYGWENSAIGVQKIFSRLEKSKREITCIWKRNLYRIRGVKSLLAGGDFFFFSLQVLPLYVTLWVMTDLAGGDSVDGPAAPRCKGKPLPSVLHSTGPTGPQKRELRY